MAVMLSVTTPLMRLMHYLLCSLEAMMMTPNIYLSRRLPHLRLVQFISAPFASLRQELAVASIIASRASALAPAYATLSMPRS